jgi:pyruvate/2-oxoglutarate dehydrogenase complex dihydrolipoamide dehydrogenase (E3) component
VKAPLRSSASPVRPGCGARRLAVHNAFGGGIAHQSRLRIPWCTYCDPEIAHTGMHLREARDQSIPVKSFTIVMQQ